MHPRGIPADRFYLLLQGFGIALLAPLKTQVTIVIREPIAITRHGQDLLADHFRNSRQVVLPASLIGYESQDGGLRSASAQASRALSASVSSVSSARVMAPSPTTKRSRMSNTAGSSRSRSGFARRERSCGLESGSGLGGSVDQAFEVHDLLLGE